MLLQFNFVILSFCLSFIVMIILVDQNTIKAEMTRNHLDDSFPMNYDEEQSEDKAQLLFLMQETNEFLVVVIGTYSCHPRDSISLSVYVQIA